ncbi:hypothetical protein [Fontivita pretiosa]|uniref:hypothetical protein n=1 Tax=Fontivita pretiosa TaxID=2989684 RepID=UPI003D184557
MLLERLCTAAMNAHIAWLRQFGDLRVKRFEAIRRSNPQGAICDALIARHLRQYCELIEPYEDFSTGGPDYRCRQKGHYFYVEVTSLDTKAIERELWIPDDPTWKGGSVGSIAKLLRTCISGKVTQCRHTDAPTLIAVGMLHLWASIDVEHLAEDMLISHVEYVVPIRPAQACPTERGQLVTGLRNALFLEAAADGLKDRRQPVAGVLVFGLGAMPPRIVGVINGRAFRSFDPTLMPQIKFATCEIIDNRISIQWYNDGHKECPAKRGWRGR